MREAECIDMRESAGRLWVVGTYEGGDSVALASYSTQGLAPWEVKKLRHAVFVGLCEGGETHKAGVALHCGRAAARWWAERAERKGWPTLKNFRLGTSMRLRRRKDKA